MTLLIATLLIVGLDLSLWWFALAVPLWFLHAAAVTN